MFKNMSNRTKNILSGCIMAILLLFAASPFFIHAQEIVLQPPFKSTSIVELIRTIINEILLPIGGVVAVLMVMYAGFQYVTAQGNPGKIKDASNALRWAVIGAAILLGAWVIANAIKATIDQLKG
jgi:hypothetical protein